VENVPQPNLADRAFASAGVSDHYAPQLLASAPKDRRRFGMQCAVAYCAKKVGVVVDTDNVATAVRREQARPAGDGLHDGAVPAPVNHAPSLTPVPLLGPATFHRHRRAIRSVIRERRVSADDNSDDNADDSCMPNDGHYYPKMFLSCLVMHSAWSWQCGGSTLRKHRRTRTALSCPRFWLAVRWWLSRPRRYAVGPTAAP